MQNYRDYFVIAFCMECGIFDLWLINYYQGETIFVVYFIVFIIVLFSVIILSNNLSKGNILHCIQKLALPFLVLFGLFDWIMNVQNISLYSLLSSVILGIITMHTFPLLYFLTNKGSKQNFFGCTIMNMGCI